MTSIALFNNKGGVGKTTLTYHLAHMLNRQGHRVLAVDLDPQSNLTSVFLDDEELESIWREPDGALPPDASPRRGPRETVIPANAGTIVDAVEPILKGLGDIRVPAPVEITYGLWLLAGDLKLSSFEARLSDAWPRGVVGDDAALRITTAFYRVIEQIRRSVEADLVLIDVGPNLGAINRAALLSADTVLMPLAADLFSLRGLRNLGPTLRDWRRVWQRQVLPEMPADIEAPSGSMLPLGYVIMQPSMRLDRPVQAYQRWLDRIPEVFAAAVLDSAETHDEYELATLKNYRSLMPLAHDARKPMFDLRTADGAIGSTQTYVQKCYQDFQHLANALVGRLAQIAPERKTD
ncbi:cellulose biosynthesis protein BcsQ [Crossiella equi]|uniref:Cellulose biosynthesis protein BcsQ n=1 Tax=Crossiella equi TaxID=130796 RepID=A0ABS5AJZ6_9PSEU|nr:ParA family protein [Crossiella equi]MBP2476894.1 cellulose biosynthesis protein BcsQ [Crossiella equi]